MDLKKIEEFIELAKKSGVSELMYESKKTGDKLSVSFPFAGATVGHSIHHIPSHSIPSGTSGEIAALKTPVSDGCKEITSPFVGTFYKSSAPDAAPYVKVGDRVSEGQVLCIIEAMKIMNEIESDIAGEIVEICVENETYVEFGQVMFRIRP